MKFLLQLLNGDQKYTFEAVRDDDELPHTVHYYVGQPHKTYKACVHVEVDIVNKYAVLQWIALDKKCSMEDDWEDIVLLGKAALKYVLHKHPSIQYFSLDDKAEKTIAGGKRIMITARLMLQGQQGWYQKHFEAVPTPDTMRILRAIQKRGDLVQKYLPITTTMNWGNEKEVTSIAEKIIPQYAKRFTGTTWLIPSAVVKGYDVVVVKTSRKPQKGGGGANMVDWYVRRVMDHVMKKG